MSAVHGSTNKPTIEQLASKVSEELKARPQAEVASAMNSGAGVTALLSPTLAAEVGKLGSAELSLFNSKVAASFFSGIAGLASASGSVRHVSKEQIDFGNATIGTPDPKKALRLSINLPAGYIGPDALVYPSSIFDKQPNGDFVPRTIIIGKTKESVQVKPGDPIVDGWSGAQFKGRGFVIHNAADNNVIPVAADGLATQILVNSVDTVKLAKTIAIFGGRQPGDMAQTDLKAALTRVATEISNDMYLGENADYAKNNLDPVDTSHGGICLHSKKEMLTAAVRLEGKVSFNSPDAGTSEQNFANGCVIIKTKVKDPDGSFREVVRGILPEKFDADGYKDVAGNPMTFASLPVAIVKKQD